MRGQNKGDLHCHAILSAPAAAYRRLGALVPDRLPKYGSWLNFETAISEYFLPALRSLHDFEHIMAAAFEAMVSDGVTYCEPSYDLALPGLLGAPEDQLLLAIERQVARWNPRLEIRPIFGVIRTLPLDPQLERAAEWATSRIFHGVDVYGDERAASWSSVAPLFELAGREGLLRKAHVGEFGSAAEVRQIVERFELDEVQHGVRALEDPATIEWLSTRGTQLNVCPTSNVALGIYPDLDRHPVVAHLREGPRVAITINTDDFALFGQSLSEELIALQMRGVSARTIDQLRARSLARASETQAHSGSRDDGTCK